jgi:hypothetical protein
MNAVLAPIVEAMEFSLRSRVRESLEGDEPDPHKIAEILLQELTPSEAAAALAATLPSYVRLVAKEMRRSSVHSATTTSTRWDNVAQLQSEGTLTLLRARVFASGAWKFLGDCTRDDVTDIAAQRTQEAVDLEATAKRFRQLREAMGRKRVSIVSQLPTNILTEIFDAN